MKNIQTAHCPSLGAFLRSLPAGARVGRTLKRMGTPEELLAARPPFVASWAVRVQWAPGGDIAAFVFCAGPATFGAYVVQLPQLAPSN